MPLDRGPEPSAEVERKEKGWARPGLWVAFSANRRERVAAVFLEELQEHRDRAWALWLRVEKRMSPVNPGTQGEAEAKREAGRVTVEARREMGL